jgi:hypothetical protein
MTMLAIANERVNASVGDAEVHALPIGTGVAFGGYADGGLPAGFSPQTRGAQEQTLALPPMKEER